MHPPGLESEPSLRLRKPRVQGAQDKTSIHPVNRNSQRLAHMDNALAMVESSTLGLLSLITGTSPPPGICELLLPPLDIVMPAPTSSGRVPPGPIQTNLKIPLSASTAGKDSLPSVGPGAYDTTVIPPSHGARTLVLCFDGTGDQFDADVRIYALTAAHVHLADLVLSRIPISFSFSLC